MTSVHTAQRTMPAAKCSSVEAPILLTCRCGSNGGVGQLGPHTAVAVAGELLTLKRKAVPAERKMTMHGTTDKRRACVSIFQAKSPACKGCKIIMMRGAR